MCPGTGTVWINCTNLFDAASGFGGYRESGFGREGGREGLWEYVRARVEDDSEDVPIYTNGGRPEDDEPEPDLERERVRVDHVAR